MNTNIWSMRTPYFSLLQDTYSLTHDEELNLEACTIILKAFLLSDGQNKGKYTIFSFSVQGLDAHPFPFPDVLARIIPNLFKFQDFHIQFLKYAPDKPVHQFQLFINKKEFWNDLPWIAEEFLLSLSHSSHKRACELLFDRKFAPGDFLEERDHYVIPVFHILRHTRFRGDHLKRFISALFRIASDKKVGNLELAEALRYLYKQKLGNDEETLDILD